MTWINHKLVAFSLTFAVTKDIVPAIFSMVSSVIPDWIEFAFRGLFKKHRGMSHNVLFWLCLYAGVFIVLTPPFYVNFIFVGIALHLFTDFLSKKGIPIGKKYIGLGLYKTYSTSEYVLTLCIISVCFIITHPVELIVSVKKYIDFFLR